LLSKGEQWEEQIIKNEKRIKTFIEKNKLNFATLNTSERGSLKSFVIQSFHLITSLVAYEAWLRKKKLEVIIWKRAK
jgi:hypothetical protein